VIRIVRPFSEGAAAGVAEQIRGDRAGLRLAAGAEQSEHIMQIGEDQTAIRDPRLGDQRQLLPAIPDGDAVQLEPLQQRGGIGQIAEIIGRNGTDRAVIEAEDRVDGAELELEQRHVPMQMEAEIAAMAPGLGTAEP